MVIIIIIIRLFKDSFRLRRSRLVRANSGGGLHFPVVKGVINGLTATPSPTEETGVGPPLPELALCHQPLIRQLHPPHPPIVLISIDRRKPNPKTDAQSHTQTLNDRHNPSPKTGCTVLNANPKRQA
eukprot:1196324-Prorocentrum_minimum.AAC.5